MISFIQIICSSTVILLLSSIIASSALLRGLISLFSSAMSRAIIVLLISSKSIFTPLFFNSLCLLLALISTEAVMNIFISASGKTTVPISLPSITIPFETPICLCSSTIRGPYFRDLTYSADMSRHFHAPYLLFDIFGVQKSLIFIYIGIKNKIDMNIF